MRSPHDHYAWAERCKHRAARHVRFKRSGGETNSSTSSSSVTPSERKLTLSKKLQASLVTQAGLDPSEAEEIWANLAQELN